MGIVERQLKVSELQTGMFVSRLDRPWSETDFLLEGVQLRSQADIDHLKRYCQHVFIDETRSQYYLNALKVVQPTIAAVLRDVSPADSPLYINPKTWRERHCVEHYAVSTTFARELKQAKPLLQVLELQITQLSQKIAQHQRVRIEPLVESTTDLIESIIRNPDALAWLCRIQHARKPVFMHMIRLTVWAGIVGRQLGLNRFALVHLTMALMMTGIGKSLRNPADLKQHNVLKHGTSYREHLDDTLYHLTQTRFSCQDIITTIEHYCERHNGSGYPQRKSGEKIPFLARVAGLIDTFEFLVHPLNGAGISPANAIGRLNKLKGTLFDAPLVEEFVRAVGIYPTGSVVEVNDGTIGMVVSNSYEKRVQASIVPLVKADGTAINTFRVRDLDLAERSGSRMIKRSLPAQAVPHKLLLAAHQELFEPKQLKRGLLHKLVR